MAAHGLAESPARTAAASFADRLAVLRRRRAPPKLHTRSRRVVRDPERDKPSDQAARGLHWSAAVSSLDKQADIDVDRSRIRGSGTPRAGPGRDGHLAVDGLRR